MKSKFLLIFVWLSLVVSTQAQNGVSAEVYFSLTYKGMLPEEMVGLPKQVTFLVSGNNTKQIVASYESTMYVIANGDSIFLANLTDIEDDRVGLLYKADDIAESTSIYTIKIKSSKEKKTILGYPCKKYIISIYNKETKEKMKDVVYATEKIGGENVNFLLYKGLKGFILSSEKTKGEEITTMIAKRVVKKDIPASEFLIPDEYTITTYKDQVKQDK